MSFNRTIILIGLRGSGKTTLGRQLAIELRMPFVDLDDHTPGELGESDVRTAFSRFGEAAFRRAERAALERVLGERPCVLALGGGTPTAPGAAELLDQASRGGAAVVYLRATAATLRARLERMDNTHRPSLTGAGVLNEIDVVLAARDGLYRSLARYTVECDGLSAERMMAEVRQCITPRIAGEKSPQS